MTRSASEPRPKQLGRTSVKSVGVSETGSPCNQKHDTLSKVRLPSVITIGEAGTFQQRIPLTSPIRPRSRWR